MFYYIKYKHSLIGTSAVWRSSVRPSALARFQRVSIISASSNIVPEANQEITRRMRAMAIHTPIGYQIISS